MRDGGKGGGKYDIKRQETYVFFSGDRCFYFPLPALPPLHTKRDRRWGMYMDMYVPCMYHVHVHLSVPHMYHVHIHLDIYQFFKPYFFATQFKLSNKIHGLKYLRSTTLSCKDIWIRKSRACCKDFNVLYVLSKN